MAKLTNYLEDLKSGILKEDRKKLLNKLNSTLAPLTDEKKNLETILTEKNERLKEQKAMLIQTREKKLKSQFEESRKNLLIRRIWEKVLNEFFSKYSGEWYESFISVIPKEKGTLRYAAKNTPDAVLKKIQKNNSQLNIKSDNEISYGMVYESEKEIIEFTKEVFSDENFPMFKRKLYQELKGVQVL